MDEQNYQQKIAELAQELETLKANYKDKSIKIDNDFLSLNTAFIRFKNQSQRKQEIFIPLLRAAGYTLLTLTLIDYINTFIKLNCKRSLF
jgi:hypothetical protein